MTEKEKQEALFEVRKEITIERLRQAPPTVKISFGSSNGNFMDRNELIENVQNNTEIGKRIVEIQLGYLKAFKSGTLMED
ncbi:MAG: hypothetical protein KAU21_08410 [Gammaproteobacteria bacterium]|nr:hypothetical protein [Gammaproteobacteria bacterium]